jgi:hypothetical protein
MNATEPVYMELVDFVARGSTAAQVASFRPSPEAQERVAELLQRQRESKLTEDEASELDGFVHLSTSSVWPKRKLNESWPAGFEVFSRTARRSCSAGDVSV